MKKYKELLKDNRIVFGKNGESGPQRKRFIWEAKERGKVVKNLWNDIETTTNGTQLLKKIFNGKSIFDNPKPVELLTRILNLSTSSKGYNIILDFFLGFRVIIMSVANSLVKSKVLKILQKFKTRKMKSWCAV